MGDAGCWMVRRDSKRGIGALVRDVGAWVVCGLFGWDLVALVAFLLCLGGFRWCISLRACVCVCVCVDVCVCVCVCVFLAAMGNTVQYRMSRISRWSVWGSIYSGRLCLFALALVILVVS